MKVVTVTGAYGTGSSAVVDLLREYSNIAQPSKSNFEIMFFFDYNGIPNLRYWFTRGHRCQQLAVDDFLHEAEVVAHFGTRMNYEKYFGGRFMVETKKYIESLQGEPMGEFYANNFFKMNKIQNFIWRFANKVYYSLNNHQYNKFHTDIREKSIHLFGEYKKRFVSNVSDEMFIALTKSYLDALFLPLSNGMDIMVLDGFVGTNYIDDISIYYDDFTLFNVLRDPRDVYLSSKYVWKTEAVPNEVDNFCRWYRSRVDSVCYKNSNVINIQFEDLIYNYEETVLKIEQNLGLDSDFHTYKGKYFAPDLSRNNTRLWEKYPQESDNIEYIKREISDLIYDF